MTDMKTDRPPYVPARQPVRRFVVVLLGLAVLFGTLWWSGLAAPRLSLGADSSGMYDSVTGRATSELILRNRSALAVEVRDVTLGEERAKVASVQVKGHDLAAGGQTIAGRSEATLVLGLTCNPGVDHRRQPPSMTTFPIRLEITVKTLIGLERTRTIRTVQLPTTCFR